MSVRVSIVLILEFNRHNIVILPAKERTLCSYLVLLQLLSRLHSADTGETVTETNVLVVNAQRSLCFHYFLLLQLNPISPGQPKVP